jgi:hypothetical protein
LVGNWSETAGREGGIVEDGFAAIPEIQNLANRSRILDAELARPAHQSGETALSWQKRHQRLHDPCRIGGALVPETN